jgi:hypothetical protein
MLEGKAYVGKIYSSLSGPFIIRVKSFITLAPVLAVNSFNVISHKGSVL